MSIGILVGEPDFRLPQNLSSFIMRIPFSNHHESKHVQIESFRERFFLCTTRAVSCCDQQRENITDKVLDAELDKIFSTHLGVGLWLKVKRSRDLTPSSLNCSGGVPEAERREKDCDTVDIDGIDLEAPFAETIKKIQTATRNLHNEATALKERDADKLSNETKKRKPKKRKTKKQDETRIHKSRYVPWKTPRKIVEERSRLLLEMLQNIPETAIESKTEHQQAITSVQLLVPTAQLCGAVGSGVSQLHSPKDAVFRLGSFGQIVAYRNLESENYKEGIQQLLEQSECDVQETANNLVWVSKLLSSGTRIIRRNIDNTYMESRDIEKETQLKRKDGGFENIHKIVNELHSSQHGNAWLVYGALEMQGAEGSAVARVAKESALVFVSTVASQLASQDWASTPDAVEIFHLPAVLSWTLRMSFEETCKGLGLSNFSCHNPEIAEQLDKIAEKFVKLEGELPTLTEAQARSKRIALEIAANAAMRVSLGKLRAICSVAEQATDATRADTVPPANVSLDSGTGVSNTDSFRRNGYTAGTQQVQLPNGYAFGVCGAFDETSEAQSSSWASGRQHQSQMVLDTTMRESGMESTSLRAREATTQEEFPFPSWFSPGGAGNWFRDAIEDASIAGFDNFLTL
ncbi:hypothetical protein CI238_11621 [Colletotrichum incanum]|uniref:Uncharacterized protein n=1 Tax=Colletotrichum incanum TaxID=1573173 RepID=A0A162Q7E8_COLIC|nr:hypothetical protein CI238_11621 [Colletotrichum incanum]